MTQPRRVGDRIGRLIGAADGTVVVGDTLSIKVYQALASALDDLPRHARRFARWQARNQADAQNKEQRDAAGKPHVGGPRALGAHPARL